MKKIMITQAILWAAAIITTALVPPSYGGGVMTVLAAVAIGTLHSEGVIDVFGSNSER